MADEFLLVFESRDQVPSHSFCDCKGKTPPTEIPAQAQTLILCVGPMSFRATIPVTFTFTVKGEH